MAEQDVAKRTEEFRRKKEELKRRAFEEELRRVERETEERGKELSNMLHSKDEHLYQERLREAESKRNQDEESLRKRESEIQSKLADERRKKQSRRQEEILLRREEDESRRSSIEAKLRAEDDQKKVADEAARKKASEEDTQKRAEEDARRRVEELKAKREEEARLKAEEERYRKEDEARQRAESESRNRADMERRRQEEQLRLQREEFQRQDEERRRQEEQRRADAERKRKEDEERRVREAEVRRRQEEERRVREAEELKLRVEREAREREEAEARREIEERQRQEAEAIKRRSDELQRERDEQVAKVQNEKEARILDLMTKAETLFTQGDLKAALVEVAKALVNDPKNPSARELERTIKEELGTLEPPKKDETKTAAAKPRQAKKRLSAQRRITEGDVKKPFFTRTLIAAICVGVIAAGAILYVQFKDRLFPKEITFAIVPWTSSANIAEETTIGTALSEEVAREFERQTRTGMLGYASTYALVRSSPEPARSIFALGYPYILEGSLTKSAVGFNLSVRLVNSIGSVYWAQTFIKSEASLPDLPAEVAGQVAKAVNMSGYQSAGSASMRPTSSVSAYGEYLRGLELIHRGTPESNVEALGHFRQAIVEDVNFSNAYAYAASAYLTMYERGWNKNDSVLTNGRQFAEGAVGANARGTLGHVVYARILVYQKNYGGAFEQLETALKLSPGNSDIYVQRGFLLLRTGKDKEALEALARAYELNPRDGSVLRMLGLAYQIAGTPAQATWYHQNAVFFADDSTDYIAGPLADALMLDPAFSPRDSRRVGDAFERRLQADPRSYRDLYRLGRMQQVTGNVRQGSASLERAEKILREEIQKNPKNTDALTTLGLTLTRLGKFSEANALAHKALELSGDDIVTKYKAAQILSLQLYSAQKKKTDEKKKQEALSLLREAVGREFNLVELANGDFYNMHDQPEFRAAISVSKH